MCHIRTCLWELSSIVINLNSYTTSSFTLCYALTQLKSLHDVFAALTWSKQHLVGSHHFLPM